jgi:hypothetical protein
MMRNSNVIEYCQNRIRRRLHLGILPEILIKIRNFAGPDSYGHYKIQPNDWNIIEPAELWCKTGYFKKVIGEFAREYHQLSRDTNWRIPLTSFLIEPIISLGSSSMQISGGFNWLVMGVLKSKEKYCAVLDVEVRPLFCKCGLANLLKHAELELARQQSCDFIQTWHWAGNQHFNAAIAPGLKSGFTLYRGNSHDGEVYEDRGYIHLRYYFDKTKKRSVEVKTKDGKTFKSPDDNFAIMDYLEAFPHQYPGRMIQSIEEYSKAKPMTRIKTSKRIAKNDKGGPDRQRIFIAQGAAGFEHTRQRNTYRIGNNISFYPILQIDHFKKSGQTKPCLKHVIYNIYEFCFKVEAVQRTKDTEGMMRNDYILELPPNIKVCCHDWKKENNFIVDQWYVGYGRLAIGDHRASTFAKPPSHVQDIAIAGKLIGISDDLLQRDFFTKYAHQVKRFRYGKDVYGDEDALEWFGYYRDFEKFKTNVSSYKMNPVEYESTDSHEPGQGYSPKLIFCIEITAA